MVGARRANARLTSMLSSQLLIRNLQKRLITECRQAWPKHINALKPRS